MSLCGILGLCPCVSHSLACVSLVLFLWKYSLTSLTVGLTVLVLKSILAKLADEHGFIEFLHDLAVGFLGYLESLLAIGHNLPRLIQFIMHSVQ